jgi:hypothetical protein
MTQRFEDDIDVKLHSLLCAASSAVANGATEAEVREAFEWGLREALLDRQAEQARDSDTRRALRKAWEAYTEARGTRRAGGDYSGRWYPPLTGGETSEPPASTSVESRRWPEARHAAA